MYYLYSITDYKWQKIIRQLPVLMREVESLQNTSVNNAVK